MKIVSLVSSLFTLSSITANDIQTYFTLAFFAILLLLILGFLIGLWRGMWNSGFRLIFIGLLVAGAFLFTRNIADWLASVDIKAMMANFGVNLTDVSFNMSETSTITVEITNIKDMIISAVGQVYEAVGLGSASTTAAIELITGLTMVFLRYITFIIEVVLIVFIGEPLAAFFYHVIFKWFLPRNVRKHMKVRLAGGFMNMVKVGLVGTMLLIPFSALLNTINQAFQNPDNAIAEGVDDPTYQKVMEFINAYNDSTFAQVLFNWSVNEEGKTLDVVLMDYLTDENMGDLQLSLSTELYTIAGIGKTVLSTGIAEGGTDALLTQLLANENLIASMFVDIANSGLIMEAIPVALAIAMNMDQVKQYVDPALLNFDEVNWHEELLNLGDIADQVVASGVVSDVMNAPGPMMVPTILNSLANPDKYPAVRQALADIDNSEFLAQVVPAVLFKMAQDDEAPVASLSISDFLPSDWADYQNLHIGEELTLFYDCFYNMANNIDATFLPTLIDVITNSGGGAGNAAATPRVLGAQSNLTPGEDQHATRPVSYVAGTGTMTDLIDIIRAHVDDFITILVGTLNSSGEPTGITSDGKTDLSVTGAKPCILDSSLLLYGMGNVLNYGLTAMVDSLTAGSGVTVDPAVITVAVEELQGADMAERRVNYKREYGSLLEIVGAAIQNDAIAELIGTATTPSSSSSSSSAAVNPGAMNNDMTPLRADSSSATSSSENVFMDLINNEEVRNLIKDEICPLIDRSILMNAILPSVLESLISGANLTSTLDMVGLTAADFNFENLAIGTEIANFVDLAGYAMNLTDITGPDAINVIADHAPDIVGVLDCIYKSNIINPKDSLGNFASDNYYTLLESVFGQVADLGVNTEDVAAAIESVPEDAWLTTYDGLGNVVAYGENFRMIDTIVTAVNSGLFDLMGSTNILADLNAPAYDGAITSIFAAVERSTVMSGCFGSVLDGLIGTTGGLLDPTGTGTSFRNVTDWAAEGANLEFLIHSLADFGSDINSIDFMNSDPVLINNLLQGLAASQIFDKPDGTYLFNQFLFEKLIATDFKTYLYDKDETETSFVGASAFDVAKSDFDSIGSTTSLADKAAWSDEIDRLAGLIGEVKIFTDAHGGTDAFASLTDGSATAADIEPIILAANNCTILHMVIYNVFDSMLGGGAMNMGSLNPADANTAALITMSKEQRDTEIGLTLDIYGSIQSLGIDTGFTADKIDSAIIGSMLTNLHDSLIFNTIKSENSRLAGDLTIFEQTVKMIFTTSTIDTYIYKNYAAELREGMLEDTIFGIGNNLAGTTADPDGWIGVNGEIAHLVNIMETYKATAINFTDLGADAGAAFTTLLATPEGKAKVENVLIAINHSLIAYPAIPNLFDEVLNAGSFVMGDLNPSDSNTMILSTLDVNERDAEISGVLDIHGAIQDLGLDTGFTADKIDSAKISDLLTMLHDSKIFNTLKAGKDRLNLDLTVFEQTVKMIFTTSQIDTYVYKKFAAPLHSGMLSEDLIAIGNNFAGTTLDADGWLGLNGEIASLANIMETYKATAIDFTDLGTDGGGTVTTLLATPEGTVKVQNMLIAINHDAIAYPAIPNLFDDVLGSGDFVMGDLDPADANTAIMLTLDEATRDAEIINVLDIHDSIKGLGLDTGFSADKIDGAAIQTLLTQLHDSNIFNTIKAEKSRALFDLTVFEQTYKMIITNSTMDGYIYKLYALALRSGLLSEDIISVGNDMYGNNVEVDGWMGAGNELERLIDILDAFKATAIDFTAFGTNGAETVSGLMDTPEGTAKVENLLLAMNHSEIVYPAIPNLFDTMLTATDVTMPGVDMASANTHYTGDRFMTPYDDSEISQVMVIYGDMKNISSLNYTNLSLLSNTDIDSAAILLTDFAESKIFHLEGAASGVPADPTVFEQMMIKIMDDTGLSTQINDTLNPNPAYYDGLVYKFASAHEKALYLVTNYDTFYAAGDYFTDAWDGAGGEIDHFLRIFRELKRIIPSMTTTTIDTSGLTPENVSDILAVLNYSNLGSDAVPKLVRDSFTTMSIGTYTEGNEEYYLSVMNYNDTELDQKDYTNYPLVNPTTTKEGLLHVMLDGFWDETVLPNAYIDMSGAFSLADYINNGKSTKNLMQFLEGSQILAPVVEDDGVSILYETRSLMFYNLLDNVDMTKYIRPLTGGTKATRSTQLEDIFTSDFDYVMEGNGLDALIVDLINLTSVVDTTSLEGQGAAAAGLIESTYLATGDTITDRAYMSSELTAGFYTDVLTDDYTLAEANLGHDVEVIDFYDTDFEQLCPREARGTEAVLSIVPEIDAIITAPTTQAEVDELRASFVAMGSVAACTAPGPVWVDGNSNIAQLVYASRVISNPNFTAAVAAMAFGFPPVTVEDDPYVNGFVFETEGNKVCDYFETFI